jgi:hypothetical protein
MHGCVQASILLKSLVPRTISGKTSARRMGQGDFGAPLCHHYRMSQGIAHLSSVRDVQANEGWNSSE